MSHLGVREVGPDFAKLFRESGKLVAAFGLLEQFNDAIAFGSLTHLVVHCRLQLNRRPKMESSPSESTI